MSVSINVFVSGCVRVSVYEFVCVFVSVHNVHVCEYVHIFVNMYIVCV